MTIRDVDDLRRQLDGIPGYWPVVVEVTVGGDLVTDVVDLELIEGRAHDGAGAYLVLVHAPDPYDVRALIDDGLLLRALIEAGEFDPLDARA